ncbi:NrfD/PsrC family molybdoenzyme membrane anchor subunit [Desulfitobacterium hafniense]|uniref:NrfD/PsrC family molybdoenzyme membrane anchor subunit n=1 Tax=Desulfitobacterium hafniense TaxID=49338 RepID=UPI00036C5ECC|nr:NrfD/PsrC family molybdoenzyme membrane anchor subunit [Desulfitobacterium hafniense]
MHLHWQWLIVIYLFLGGLGAGAYLTSYAAGRGWLGNSPALKRAGYFIAAPIVAFGTVLLVFDLGQGLKKPWLLIGLLSNFSSVMTWGVYILALFICVGLVVAFFVWKKKAIPGALEHLGALLAFSTCAYTGLLVAVVEAIPFWNTYVMPVLFVVSAISTGLSITVLVGNIIDKGVHADEYKISKLHFCLVSVEIILVAFIFSVANAGGGVKAASAAQAISGGLALWFWLFLVVLGLVVPLLISAFAVRKLGRSAHTGHALHAAAGSGNTVALEQGQGLANVLLLSDALVVLGGFVLRYVVIFAALPIWNGTLM